MEGCTFLGVDFLWFKPRSGRPDKQGTVLARPRPQTLFANFRHLRYFFRTTFCFDDPLVTSALFTRRSFNEDGQVPTCKLYIENCSF